MQIKKSKNIRRLHRKLSDKHVVWFQETKQWVAFEKPAYKVYKGIRKGESIKKISKKIARKYRTDKKEAKQFVTEITENLNKITSVAVDKESFIATIDEIRINSNQESAAENKNKIYHYYSINQKILLVEYTHGKLAHYLHAPIKHFETKKAKPTCQKLIISVKKNGFSIFRSDSEIGRYDNLTQLKHAFTNQLMYAVYGIDDNEWCAWIHSSGVSKGQKAAIFVSSSGSGKSTMAAILQNRNFSVISDDVAYIKRNDKLTYPVPGALSVKDGAIKTVSKYLPDFKPDKLEVFNIADKKIRFMPCAISAELFKPQPVRIIIFINYNPKSTCKIKKLSEYDAFYRLQQQARLNDSKESAKAFINWFLELEYFELEYSDSEQALGEVEALFKDNP